MLPGFAFHVVLHGCNGLRRSLPLRFIGEIPNLKSQIPNMLRISENEIIKTVLVIGYWNLFVICLPAVFLAGCLLFEILTGGICRLVLE